MSIEERIESEFKAAMKGREALKVSTLRMLKAEITNSKIKAGDKKFEDADIIKIIRGQVKKHRDSIEQFEKGKRQDLADKEKKELGILLTYLPEEIPEDRLKEIASETISELGASGKKDMGRVMKAVMEKVKQAADGKTVSRVVSGLLGKE